MAHRLAPPDAPLEILHDGERIAAQRGESLAAALIAADRLLLARSPKLHRPRGPYCLRGACDGCLARVDGTANVMTCLVQARGGESVETQNVLGSRGADLLQAADFLFPLGIDHHRLFAGVRGISNLLSTFARSVAGLGKLPSTTLVPRPGKRVDVDVLVVGGGAAGLAAAAEIRRGRTLLADLGLCLGGSVQLLDPEAAKVLVGGASAAGVTLMERTAVAGIYREPDDGTRRPYALLIGPDGATLVRARAIVVASGQHDPALAFENNDLPGVFTARAALALWRAGIAVGRRIVLAGNDRFGECLSQLAQSRLSITRCEVDALLRAVGRMRVSGVLRRAGSATERLDADALVLGLPGPAAVQLLRQSGARIHYTQNGYAPELGPDGRVAERVFCAGSCRGESSDSRDTRDSRANGEHIGRAVDAFLGQE
jgi:sarcosine oxidase subunit alpha